MQDHTILIYISKHFMIDENYFHYQTMTSVFSRNNSNREEIIH